MDLLTRNQGPTSIHEVQIQSQNFPSISLQHSEIGVGETVTDSIQIPFDPNEEPEPLVWEVTYTDASGNRSETILQ
ncbi:MAG: hypothetical protein GWO19_13640 [Nitrospinaceae bacterium]|nr:hypothetical protein [Nitrospinaceae bacterium]